jgi:hypothetical protein
VVFATESGAVPYFFTGMFSVYTMNAAAHF